jgi:hypothetical protein
MKILANAAGCLKRQNHLRKAMRFLFAIKGPLVHCYLNLSW